MKVTDYGVAKLPWKVKRACWMFVLDWSSGNAICDWMFLSRDAHVFDLKQVKEVGSRIVFSWFRFLVHLSLYSKLWIASYNGTYYNFLGKSVKKSHGWPISSYWVSIFWTSVTCGFLFCIFLFPLVKCAKTSPPTFLFFSNCYNFINWSNLCYQLKLEYVSMLAWFSQLCTYSMPWTVFFVL